jgi:hypothetical protein
MWYAAVFDNIAIGTQFSIGISWVVLSLGALVASMINIIRGKHRGNMNLLATLLLGFFPGINTIVAVSAEVLNMVYEPRVYGMMYILGAIFSFGVCIRRWDQPMYIFVKTVCTSMGLLLTGVGNLLISPVLIRAGGWCLFGFALLSFYFGLSEMYPYYGESLPQGESLPVLLHEMKETRSKITVPTACPVSPLTNPSMIVAFICATFGLCSWSSSVFDLGTDSLTVIGIIRLLLGTIYFFGAIINIFNGVPGGNLNLIFAVCFGLFAGSNQVMKIFTVFTGLDVEPQIYGIVQIFAGLYLLALMPVMKHIPVYQWLANLCSSMGLIWQGMSTLLNSAFVNAIGGWFFFGFAAFNVYIGLSAILDKLPQGHESLHMMEAGKRHIKKMKNHFSKKELS